MKKLVSSFLVLGLAACASTPQRQEKNMSQINPDEKVKPTFTEKVAATEVANLNASTPCPRDGAWNGIVEWKKMVPMANACVHSGDWSKVEKMGSHLGIYAQQTPWGPYYMSLAASARKDYPRAIWMLELALKKAPQEGLFHYQLGRIYWEMDDDVAALKSLKTASDLNPSLTDAHWVMGQIELQRGDLGEAERQLLRAINNNHRHWPALMAMASVKSRAKDWSGAEAYLVKAIRTNPRSSKARVALAQVQEMQLKNLSSALSTYREIRQMVSAHKLDDRVELNIDDKIKSLEQALAQVADSKKVSARNPSNDKKVAE
jgi:tetratricopeptide (TPR) repeat protein